MSDTIAIAERMRAALRTEGKTLQGWGNHIAAAACLEAADTFTDLQLERLALIIKEAEGIRRG